ncbi:MAG: LysE family transporter [Bacteroidales bacterium]|jgi:threonine/homoserine/homoserine lactone efflux protein
MAESLITMSIAGLLAGFIFSMPIAGPVSILITSNALKGRSNYCNRVTIGASLGDFIYVFIAIFGLTKFYSLYKPAVPYILIVGSVFLIYLGYKIARTKIDLEHLEDKSHIAEKIEKKERGAFYTGCMINLLNPTLFIGWLTSSFFVISFISSLGLSTGGLDTIINQNIKEINIIENGKIEKPQMFSDIQIGKGQSPGKNTQESDPVRLPKHFHLIISLCYGFFISLGTIIWFYLMTFLIVRFRKYINIKIISAFIKSLGFVLFLFGLYFGYLAVKTLIHQ